MSFLDNVFRTKPIEVIEAEEKKEELPRELGLWDLIGIGIGGTVGSGIFATSGDIISGNYGGGAGSAAFISWAIAGLSCILSGFAYMELSSLIPSSGSTYAYSYHALGELPAFIGAWLLTLEYGMSGAGVARSWASKVQEWADDNSNGKTHEFLNEKHYNLMGFLVMAASVLILLAGIRFGKVFINIVTSTKVAIVLFIIIAGFSATKSENLSPFLPPRDETLGLYGVRGMMLGASQAFFGYVGFDEVCCLAAEAKNPRKIMPRAVTGVILGTMFLSCFASLALAGMVPVSVYSHLVEGNLVPEPYLNDPSQNLTALTISSAFGYVGYPAAKLIVRLGEVGTMPIVVLISFLAQPRLMYAMSVDGLLPEIFGRVDNKGNLFWCTVITGVFFTGVAVVVPFSDIWNMVSIGILISFMMTNTSLLILRTRDSSSSFVYKLTGAIVTLACISMFVFQKGYVDKGDSTSLAISMVLLAIVFILAVFMYVKCPQSTGSANSFRAPFVPFVPILSIVVNWYLVSQMAWIDIGRCGIWIGAAIVTYFMYGFFHSQGRTGWTKMLSHNLIGHNEVRPSLSNMVSGDMKKSLLTPNNVQ